MVGLVDVTLLDVSEGKRRGGEGCVSSPPQYSNCSFDKSCLDTTNFSIWNKYFYYMLDDLANFFYRQT